MTKEEYKEILCEDRNRSTYYYDNGIQRLFSPYNIDWEIWRFQKTLRRCEYLYSSESGVIKKITKWYYSQKFKKLSLQLGYTIPCGVFGPGLRILHRGTIVINAHARIGKNCTINADVNIGTKAGFEGLCPCIGDNVYIGPGAKLFGNITIADGCAIGANAVVTKSFTERDCIIAGIPAKVIGKVTRNFL